MEPDYIIVGAGSAGAVLANRLSEDPACTVLLIEEGPRDRNVYLHIPKGFGKTLPDPRYTHTYQVEHPGTAGGAPEIWKRGKTLGGSSAVNGMVWVRGQRADYDRFAELGNRGWSWDEMLPHFRALEHDALADDAGDGQSGRGGPVEVTRQETGDPLGRAFVAAGEAIGLRYLRNLNVPEHEGIGFLPANIDRRGRRVSSARAFLKPAARRPNLHVVTGVRIDRVLIEDGRAVGLGGVRDGAPVSFRTAGEVILSAGAIGSPRLLQLSGIGPGEHLRSVGLEVVHELAGVGANMREHRLLALQYRVRDWALSQNRSFAGIGLARSAIRYLLTGSGPLAEAACTAAAFVRTDPSLNRPDGQVMYMPYSLDRATGGFETEPGIRLFGYVLRPDSQGTVRIDGADPLRQPRITPNYLATEHDRRHSIALTRTIRQIMAQPVWSPDVIGETEETSWAHTDAEIVDAYHRLGRAGLHACGTCAMGPGPEAVVDDRLRLHGIGRLRVVDLSIFPEMLSGNTNLPVMAMASRAAQLITEDRRG